MKIGSREPFFRSKPRLWGAASWRESQGGASFQPENWKVLKCSMCPKATSLFVHTIFMTKIAKPLRFTPATNLAVRIKAILTGDGAAAQNTYTSTKTVLPGRSAPGRGAGKKGNKKLRKSVNPSSWLSSRRENSARSLQPTLVLLALYATHSVPLSDVSAAPSGWGGMAVSGTQAMIRSLL